MRPRDDPAQPIGVPLPSEGSFAGWRIVGLCAILQGLTAPGQTAGVSVFVDPMMAGLGMTRSQVSAAYLVGTLLGALALPKIGQLIDLYGARRATLLIGGAFGACLLAMSGVRGLVTVTLAFVGIRMLGQGGLSLVATTAPVPWFERRRGLAISTTTAVGSGLLSIIPIGTAALLAIVGWRASWAISGLAIWLVVLPIAWFGLVDRPSELGQSVDGGEPRRPPRRKSRTSAAPRAESMSPRQAIRTPMFWAITAGVVSVYLITTALMFHQISLLGERGLSSIEAAANYLPQTIGALGCTMLAGVLVDRLRQRYVLIGVMAVLSAAMLGLTFVRPGWSALLYGLALGGAQGAIRTVEGDAYPRLFGPAHVGRIRGIAKACAVAASAAGPLIMSWGQEWTGETHTVLIGLLLLPAAVVVAALTAKEPLTPAAPAASGSGPSTSEAPGDGS